MPRLLLLIALVIFGAACAHSPECKQRINNCMRSCAPTPPSIDRSDDKSWYKSGSADSCEKRCYAICSTSTDATRDTVEPATGPTSGPPAE